MKGTEKQIEWAEQIKENMMNDDFFKTLFAHAEKKELNKITNQNEEELYKFVEFVKKCEDAKWWIDERDCLNRTCVAGIANGSFNYKMEEID